jgi:hypothetical protein
MNTPASHRVLLTLYPRAWRARYGEELTDLVAGMRAAGVNPWRIRTDVVRAASVERLRAAEVVGDGPAPARARGGSLMVLWAWALFVLAGCTVQKFAEHWSDTVAPGNRRLPAMAFGVLVGSALCAAVLMASALTLAVPRLVGGLRSGLWPRLHRRVTVATGLSVAAGVCTVGLLARASDLTARQRNGHDLAYAVDFLAWTALGTACLVAWTAVASAAARGIELPDRLLRFQAGLCAGVTTAMVAMTAATITWWIALARQAPWALHGRPAGAPASGYVGTLAVAVVAMAAATGLGAAGSRRSARAVRELAG